VTKGEILQTVFGLVGSVLLIFCAWFLRRAIDRFDRMVEMLERLDRRTWLLEREVFGHNFDWEQYTKDG
jgi:hypothetical protein